MRPIIFFNLGSYTHFPRRFNRKNRQVYIFNTDGSVTKLPFDDIYWHVGHGAQYDDCMDLRGHQLDENGIVRYTFNVGRYVEEESYDRGKFIIQNFLDYICAYMNEGEKGIAEHRYDKLTLRKHDGKTWQDSEKFNEIRYGGLPVIANLIMPIGACFYYLCMKLSKVPKWPEWVEEGCRIDPDDFIWWEPDYYDEIPPEIAEEKNGDLSLARHEAERMKFPEDSDVWDMLDRESRKHKP